MTIKFGRRNILRGMMGGSAVMVGLPLLDCFLDVNGTALADGTALPICFGSWFAGLGYNPGRWEPKTLGPKYDMNVELASLAPFKDRINIYSGMKAYTDSHPPIVHQTGFQVCLGGGIPVTDAAFPTLDSLIADAIGTRTRFRSLEVSCDGIPQSHSSRGGSATNPSEVSPAALYTRVFGAEFKDPNAADFKPDPEIMARRSVLSVVGEQRQALAKKLGTTDRARLDEYFTSLRELEQQLELELQKPAPLEGCTIPGKVEDAKVDTVIEDVRTNHKLFAGLLAHALACGQTRVINVAFSAAGSGLRRAGNGVTMHVHSHEEGVDEKIGCQPNFSWFVMQGAEAFGDMLSALDSVKEGDGTLLDRSLIMYSSDTGHAKIHALENMPLFTAGRAGGRMKTGIHFQANGDPATRVGLTVQQVMGVQVGTWGTESNRTSKTITEVVA